jgi:peptide/nickel transport system permease protein
MTVFGLGKTDSSSLFARIVLGVLRSPKAAVAAGVCGLLFMAAAIGPMLVPQNPFDLTAIDIADAKLPPGETGLGGTVYWLGTDAQGRDMLSAMTYGIRTSLLVGVSSGVFALVVGSILGLLSAFAGRCVDAIIMRTVDLMLGLPTILIALMLLAFLGQGLSKVILALVLVQWAFFARTMRGAALAETGKEYVRAARCLGLSSARILFGHILPNCLPPIIVVATLQVANSISAEATLSFLGIGLPITEPSLGLLIANGYQVLLSGRYWISVYPGLLLLVLIFSINIVGDRLREILNPRLGRG